MHYSKTVREMVGTIVAIVTVLTILSLYGIDKVNAVADTIESLPLMRCEVEDPNYPWNFEPITVDVPIVARSIEENVIQEDESEEEVEEVIQPTRDVEYIYGSITMTEEEFDYFCRSIETEVTGDMYYQEKMYVAQVILNRVLDDRFPDTIYEVLTSENQFSYSLTPNRFANIEVTETTRQVVHDVFQIGYDTTNGALYFCSGNVDFSGWANFIFEDSVGHRFYKN